MTFTLSEKDLPVLREEPASEGAWQQQLGSEHIARLSPLAIDTLNLMLPWFEERPLAALLALLRGQTEIGASSASGVGTETLDGWKEAYPDTFGDAWDRCWTWGPQQMTEDDELSIITSEKRNSGQHLVNRQKRVDPRRRDPERMPNSEKKRGLGLSGIRKLRPPAKG